MQGPVTIQPAQLRGPGADCGSESSGQAYLVRVDGHSRGQSQNGDPVEAGCVGDGRGSEVVIGGRRVTN